MNGDPLVISRTQLEGALKAITAEHDSLPEAFQTRVIITNPSIWIASEASFDGVRLFGFQMPQGHRVVAIARNGDVIYTYEGAASMNERKDLLEREAEDAIFTQADECWINEPGFDVRLDFIAKQTATVAARENIYR